jgi:hypothetical protein
MCPNSAFSNAFSSAAFNTVVPAASVADASSSLSFMAIPNDHARSMRPTFYSMWLEGSARKAPAQRAPFAETPICLPHCLPQRDFLASFCNRKIQKVIVPSAQTEIFARQVSALPPKADIHRRDKVSGARAREHQWRGRCWSKTAAQKPFDGTHTRSVRIAVVKIKYCRAPPGIAAISRS